MWIPMLSAVVLPQVQLTAYLLYSYSLDSITVNNAIKIIFNVWLNFLHM